MQWTTARFWIVSLVTSTIRPLKATRRFFLSSRSSDPHAPLSTSAFQTAVIVSIPSTRSLGEVRLRKWHACDYVADALLFSFKSATDQC